jgi:hypothetical protein
MTAVTPDGSATLSAEDLLTVLGALEDAVAWCTDSDGCAECEESFIAQRPDVTNSDPVTRGQRSENDFGFTQSSRHEKPFHDGALCETHSERAARVPAYRSLARSLGGDR